MTINPRAAHRVTPDILEAFRTVAPATIGHILLEGFLDPAIRPVYKPVRAVGPALTLRLPPGDSTLTRQALDMVQPGDVLMIDTSGVTRGACWGEMTSLQARTRNAAAVIIDGGVTDITEIHTMQMPTWSRTISALVGRRLNLPGGAINVPIACGGVAVHPGDLVVADENGIVVIPPEGSLELAKKAQAAEAREVPVRVWLKRGGSLSELADLNAEQVAQKVKARGWA